MKVSIFQGPCISSSIKDNLAVLESQAKSASIDGCDLLVFPEMFLTGYNIGAEATRQYAQPIHGDAAQQASQIAAAHNIALLYGFPEEYDGEIFNSALLIDKNGLQVTAYRKSHLFGDIDKGSFSAGNSPSTVVELDGTKMGILICYDVEFVENVRHLALAGADFIAVPTALMRPYEFVATTLITARAFENQIYIAYANRCDVERELDYCGFSVIAAPDGKALARAGQREERISAVLETDRLVNSRKLNTHLSDRRPELYQSLLNPVANNQS